MPLLTNLGQPKAGETLSESLSVSVENYLEAIFRLLRDQAVARSRDIADAMQVSRASVTGMLKALCERGLVNYERYGFVTLTSKGEKLAQRVLYRHNTLRDFMVNVLGIDAKKADEAACHMEHGISKEVVDRFAQFAEFVQRCPQAGSQWINGFGYQCENPPLADETNCQPCIAQAQAAEQKKEEAQEMSVALTNLKPGEKGLIERVSGDGAVRRRIRDMGATTGAEVEVVRVAPLGDPIDVRIKGYHLALRKKEAGEILVRRID